MIEGASAPPEPPLGSRFRSELIGNMIKKIGNVFKIMKYEIHEFHEIHEIH